MKDPLVRFGVAIEGSLLRQLDLLAETRGCTRSELFRDLGRAAVGRDKVAKGLDAFATLTLVYDHHVRDLSEKLTDLQHQLGDGVRSALHVHLSQDLCLEVIVMQGRSDRLQAVADRILAMRGVKQGGIEIIAGLDADGHGQGHSHSHGDDDHEPAHVEEAARVAALPAAVPPGPRSRARRQVTPPKRGAVKRADVKRRPRS